MAQPQKLVFLFVLLIVNIFSQDCESGCQDNVAFNCVEGEQIVTECGPGTHCARAFRHAGPKVFGAPPTPSPPATFFCMPNNARF